MYSIYSFWKDIISKKDFLKDLSNLADFPFDTSAFSYLRKGTGFPDFAIRTNKDRSLITGGEFVKLKNRNNYSIAPFKSIIPSGKVNIKALFGSSNSNALQRQWQNAAHEYSLEERDVYYLIRGRKKSHQKICLVHGSFFETIDVKELIQKSFSQVLDEKLVNVDIPPEVRDVLGSIFSEQELFSRVRSVENASVKLRFRVLTEVKPEGNILNPKTYPEILDDTLNLVVPYHSDEEKANIISKRTRCLMRRKWYKSGSFPLSIRSMAGLLYFKPTYNSQIKYSLAKTFFCKLILYSFCASDSADYINHCLNP